jgi:hypothetical protein
LTIKGVGRLLTVFIAIANQTNDFALDRWDHEWTKLLPMGTTVHARVTHA